MPDPIRIDPAARQAWQGGRLLHLARLQFDVLAHLIAHAGRVVTHAQLTRDVWHTTWMSSGKVTHQQIRGLRIALGDDPEKPTYITTIRGVGWRFEAAMVDRRSPGTVLIDRATIECVLLDHVAEIAVPAGQADPSLAELAHVYKRLTGFDPVTAWATQGARR